MNKKILALSGLIILVLLSTYSLRPISAENYDAVVSLELNYGKVKAKTGINVGVEGMYDYVDFDVEYDPEFLEYSCYKPFWRGEETKVLYLKRGLLRIIGTTDYPVPRRSYILRLYFTPRREGITEIKIEGEPELIFQEKEARKIKKVDGKIWAIKPQEEKQ